MSRLSVLLEEYEKYLKPPVTDYSPLNLRIGVKEGLTVVQIEIEYRNLTTDQMRFLINCLRARQNDLFNIDVIRETIRETILKEKQRYQGLIQEEFQKEFPCTITQ